MLLAMTQFVVVIDASIVNVALPSIGAHLHFSRDDLSWVVNAYTLTFGGFLLLGGRLADLLGRRRMFMIGLGRVLARLARRRPRPVRGVADRRARGPGPRRGDRLAGGAVDHHDDLRRRRRAQPRARDLGRRSPAPAAPPGVLLGGILTSGLSWRWVLFVNVPIGIAAATAGPAAACSRASAEDGTEGFDIPGAVTVTAGLALLVYAVVDAVNVGWGSTGTLLRLAGVGRPADRRSSRSSAASAIR